jgi:hypothetical protein
MKSLGAPITPGDPGASVDDPTASAAATEPTAPVDRVALREATKAVLDDLRGRVDRFLDTTPSVPPLGDSDVLAQITESLAAKSADIVVGMISATNPAIDVPDIPAIAVDMSDSENGAIIVAPDADVVDANGNLPGSPAWEADDSAALVAAAQQLALIANSLSASLQREQIEVATGAETSSYDVWDLADACDMVTCALALVSRLAFGEYAEAAKELGIADRLLDGRATLDRVLAVKGTNITHEVEPPGIDEEGTDMNIDELTALVDERVEAGVAKALDGFGKKIVKQVKKAIAAGTPADDESSTASTEDTTTAEQAAGEDATKSTTEPVVGGEAGETDPLRAALDDVLDAVKGLRADVDVIKGTPVPVGVALNGATPGESSDPVTRGQEATAGTAYDTAMKAASEIEDPVQKSEAMTAISRARLAGHFAGAGRLPIGAPSDLGANAAG